MVESSCQTIRRMGQAGMITVCIFDAKTNLSNLMKKAQKGEIVISLRGETRRGRAVGSHPFGCKGEDWSSRNAWICFTDAFFESLSEEELRLWNGDGE